MKIIMITGFLGSGKTTLMQNILYIKIGHHGSKTSTTQEFLNAVQPDMAVISVGPDRNELPKSEVLQRLEKSNVKTYRTDSSGTVIFMSDGADITVATEQ